MKKKILYVIAVVAIALVAGWNVSRNMSEEALTDVALANVEALAQESSAFSCFTSGCSFDPNYTCYVYQNWPGSSNYYLTNICDYFRG